MNNYAALTPSFHKQVKQELSRRNFIDFVSYTMPTFQQGWFNRIIAAELQQFYFDVMAGKQPRLIIQAPPRSGKSELFSRRFPAWAFGQNPNLQMIAASYSADLSSRMNRDVQRIIDSEEYAGVFLKLHSVAIHRHPLIHKRTSVTVKSSRLQAILVHIVLRAWVVVLQGWGQTLPLLMTL